MKKLTTLLLAVLFTSSLLLAQTVDEAKKSLYYGRTATSKQILEKVLSANPKNAEAIYWLGQAYLNADDDAGAKKIYQDALNNGVNDPLIWVGIGHTELLEGQKDAARQRFEAAITATLDKKKKENPTILNAIGRANADGPANTGDPLYAVEKLKRAVELDPSNADLYINMGINYLKMGADQGGNAYEAYTNAIRIEPNNAKAKLRLGKIFESQANQEKFLQYYNDAIAADPLYAPVYLQLYNYYSDRDVNLAGGYLEKYIANSDKDCSTEFFYADYLFRAGKYQESMEKAKAMEASSCKGYKRLLVLNAYNYDRLAKQNSFSAIKVGISRSDVISLVGDPISTSKITTANGSEELLIYKEGEINIDKNGIVSYIRAVNQGGNSTLYAEYLNQAKINIESYMAQESNDKIQSIDYEFAGKLLLKFPGQEFAATNYLGKAIDSDSAAANKVKYANLIIETLGKRGKYDDQLVWYKKLSSISNGNLSKRDMYLFADASIKAKQFSTADSISRMYITKYPTENYGYLLSSKSAIAADKDTTVGSAVSAVTEYIKFMETSDKEKYKSQIISNYGYLVYVHANVTKEYTLAIKDLEGVLAADPENAYAKSTIEQIKKMMNGPKKTGTPKK